VTLRNFRYIALVEATTFLALLIASVIKNTGGSEAGVQILGPIHGLLFIAYVVFALQLREPEGWTGKQTVWILIGAVLPFGGYVVDWWLLRRERAGSATNDNVEY
jgi:integral membrane protein